MSSWFSALTEQGSKLVDVYTRDLSEFASTITSETSHLVKPIIDVLQEEEDDTTTSTSSSNNNNKNIRKGRAVQKQAITTEQRLKELQQNLNTYLVDIPPIPTKTDDNKDSSNSNNNNNESNNSNDNKTDTVTNTAEDDAFTKQFYANWNLENKTEDISLLLKENEYVAKAHSDLVPIQVKYEDFWKRYFYRYERFMEDEERRKKLQTLTKVDEELGGWDDDEGDDDDDGEYEDADVQLENIQAEYNKLKKCLLSYLNNDRLSDQEKETRKELHKLLLSECPFIFDNYDQGKTNGKDETDREQDVGDEETTKEEQEPQLDQLTEPIPTTMITSNDSIGTNNSALSDSNSQEPTGGDDGDEGDFDEWE